MSPKQIHLPDELWLQILNHLPPKTTWKTLPLVSRQLHACVEDFATKTLLPDFTISLVYSLGAGSSHRWYDIRATVSLSFESLNRHNPQYARFAVAGIHPERTGERALEKWRRMCKEGFGPEVEWRVRFAARSREAASAVVGAAQTWRVLLGIDELDSGVVVKMRRLVVADGGDAVWVDWREMLDGYFEKDEQKTRLGDILTK